MRRSAKLLLTTLIIATAAPAMAQAPTPLPQSAGNVPKAADPAASAANAATPTPLEDTGPATAPASSSAATTPAVSPAQATTTRAAAPSENTPATATTPAPSQSAQPAQAPPAVTPPPAVTASPAPAERAPVAAPAPSTTATPAPVTTPTPSAPPATIATPAAPPAPPAPNPIATALGDLIEKSVPSARQATEREWHKAVQAFYAARTNAPLWVTDKGLTDEAGALMAEISKADDWGLDAKAFNLPAVPAAGSDAAALADSELNLTRAVLTYAWHARGGRLDPSQLSKWLDQSPRPLDAKAVLDTFAASNEPARTLTDLHPKHRQFELLRQAYLKARDGDGKQAEDPTSVLIPNGPLVRIGKSHPHVALVRKRLSLPIGDEPLVYDEQLAEAVGAFLELKPRRTKKGGPLLPARPSLDNKVRASLSRKAREAAANRVTLKKYLVNLERWRWMPETLGTLHVWNNLPEYTTRVIRSGRVIHEERIIIGKPDTQTPIFSDTMRFVVFHPDWGVPTTIKVKDLLPSLQAGDDSILHRRNMRIVSGNRRTTDASSIDWESTDIRRVAIVQDPGPSNPLGQLKFMFPNKHDVYMHDTPTKNLFSSTTRAYSFGCIRVRNPQRLAELVFGADRGWNQTQIADLTSPRAQPNNRIDLNRAIPVHNTYFTLIADADGKVRSFADVYGHDKRIQAVLLDGQSIERVAQTDPALALDRKVKQLAEAPPRPRRRDDDGWDSGYWGWGPPPRNGRYRQQPPPFNDFFSGIFGN